MLPISQLRPNSSIGMPNCSRRSACPIRAAARTTVSLLERQVEVLRERNRQLERKLKDFVDVARENDTLGARVLTMARRLIARRRPLGSDQDRRGLVARGFRRRESVLVLTQATAPAGIAESRFLRVVAADSPELRSFETLFSSGKPRCGQLRDSQRDFLFGAGSRRKSARSRWCRSAPRAVSACWPADRTMRSASIRP